MGRGLVLTAEDLGSQGTAPTHPQLLDWLARRFIDSGWNVKELVKLIVMSATYRQDSDCSAALRGRDPENQLLARGPSYRLPAEVVRDQLTEFVLLSEDIDPLPYTAVLDGAAIVAFDKQSGEVRWKTDSDLPGYSLPITLSAGGVRQTVFEIVDEVETR